MVMLPSIWLSINVNIKTVPINVTGICHEIICLYNNKRPPIISAIREISPKEPPAVNSK